jgi:hypothetical protein
MIDFDVSVGQVVVPVDTGGFPTCEGCIFDSRPLGDLCKYFPCRSSKRGDNKNVVFKTITLPKG